MPRLYAIIDPAWIAGRSGGDVCEALLAAGVKWVQYRAKHSSSREMFEASQRISRRVRQVGGTFIVNDRADIARAVEASGVHVGQEDLPLELARRVVGRDKFVGCSTHNLAQVQEADRSSADYIAFGPIFATLSKQNADAVVGLEGLRRARQATRKALVAIGGITAENARGVIEAGADSVAVIHDLVGAPDVFARAREFLAALGAP